MKKATDCGLAAIVLMMLFSLVLTAKDVFLATVPKDKNAALFLCLEIVLGIVIVCLPKIISVKFIRCIYNQILNLTCSHFSKHCAFF